MNNTNNKFIHSKYLIALILLHNLYLDYSMIWLIIMELNVKYWHKNIFKMKKKKRKSLKLINKKVKTK
jgi:hypothetical protein